MTVTLHIPRVEGGLELVQDDQGAIRLDTPAPRNLEAALVGRSALDAIYLTQTLSADGGISHALAAVAAWERAAGLTPPTNGLLLRDLLHALSLLHAHMRNFYQQALLDYVSTADLSGYRGGWPELQRIAKALHARTAPAWARAAFAHPFTAAQVDRLAENQLRALQALHLLQRMLALLGGKFPMAMSIVPGGSAVNLTDALLLRLRGYLDQVRGLLEGDAFEDGLLLVGAYPRGKTQGRGVRGLICVGTTGEELGPAQSMVPAGVYLGEKLEPLGGPVTESLRRAFYRPAPGKPPAGGLPQAAPEKEGAYSWIKAPRYRNQPMEAGAAARLVITQLTGSRTYQGTLVEEIETAVGAPLTAGTTVAGRLLSRLAEVRLLWRRCDQVLGQLLPNQPTVVGEAELPRVTGQGIGAMEAPAGAVRHRVAFERGKIEAYDIIAPSTWNGSPQDERNEPGSLELALNGARLDLAQREDRLAASRIVHSFFFSTTDAVH
jgi:ferredoxin hydrogenase large subunit/hydrogenase large subunit